MIAWLLILTNVILGSAAMDIRSAEDTHFVPFAITMNVTNVGYVQN